MFHLAGIFWTSSLEGSISSNLERIASRRQGEEPGYTEVLHQRADSLNVKRLLLKKTRLPQRVGHFSLYGKRLGSLNSFLWYAPPLSGASILCFPILHFLRAQCGEWLQSDGARWQVFFPFWVPSGLTSSPLVVVVIADDCNISYSPVWQEIYQLSHSSFVFFTHCPIKDMSMSVNTKIHL